MNTKRNENEFDPKILGFLCNWCSYAAADKAGAMQKPYPANVHFIRVMCSGRVVSVITDMVGTVKELGPLCLNEK